MKTPFKLFLGIVLLLSQSVFCQKDSSVVNNKAPCVIFISPSLKIINELKQKYKDDFYIMADDENSYQASASEFVKKNLLKVYYLTLDKLKLVYPNQKMLRDLIKYSNRNPWFAIIVKNKISYKMVSLVDFEEGFRKYY